MKDYSAETGAALADEDQPLKAFAHAVVTPATRTPSPGTFATIALDRITPSLTNPRKTFDPAKLQDLAESIRSSGVHQPVVVRSLPGSRLADTDRTVQYELVVGERRLRASIIAGVDTIPAIVRTLSDNEVLEVQCVENLQRDDLAPLEEAEGYDHLMQHTGLSADDVAAKISVDTRMAWHRLTHGEGTEPDFDLLANTSNIALVRADALGELAVETVLRAEASILQMQDRYRRTGRFGADAQALQTVPNMLDFYDQLLDHSSPQLMLEALEATVRRMAVLIEGERV